VVSPPAPLSTLLTVATLVVLPKPKPEPLAPPETAVLMLIIVAVATGDVTVSVNVVTGAGEMTLEPPWEAITKLDPPVEKTPPPLVTKAGTEAWPFTLVIIIVLPPSIMVVVEPWMIVVISVSAITILDPSTIPLLTFRGITIV